MPTTVRRTLEEALHITGQGHTLNDDDDVQKATTQALASLRVALLGMVASAILSLYFAEDHPWLTAVPCVVINCAFLQISWMHGLLFSAFEIPYMMLVFYPVKWALGIPWQYAFFWLYSPILVILLRRRKDYHGVSESRNEWVYVYTYRHTHTHTHT